MSLNIVTTDDRCQVKLYGDIDHHGVGPMRAEIDEAIARHAPKVLELDFSGVEFMDSSGIGLIMGRYRALQRSGGKLIITGARGNILKVMRLSGIEQIATIQKEAVKR